MFSVGVDIKLRHKQLQSLLGEIPYVYLRFTKT